MRRPEFAMRFGKWTQIWIPPFRARCAACGKTADLGFTGTEYLCRTHLKARGSTPEAEGERLALQQVDRGGVLAPG